MHFAIGERPRLAGKVPSPVFAQPATPPLLLPNLVHPAEFKTDKRSEIASRRPVSVLKEFGNPFFQRLVREIRQLNDVTPDEIPAPGGKPVFDAFDSIRKCVLSQFRQPRRANATGQENRPKPRPCLLDADDR